MSEPKSNELGLRERLAGGRLVGTFVKLAADEAIDVVAAAGFDLAIVDREHSQLDEGGALALVRRASALGLPAVVRVPACDPGEVNRLLEAGAAGIQLSSVRSVEQVLDLVAATRYAPGGHRSVSLAHPAAGYGAVPLRDVVAVAPPLLVGQIETVDSVDPLEEIAKAGLDVLFVGVTDLTVDAGFDRDQVALRMAAVHRVACDLGVAMGAFAPNPASIPANARYVALSSDLAILRVAAAKARSDAG
jgi:4-hydroxy-2-oxoheptanedioate aldolase